MSLVDSIRAAGVVGAGGAGFPAHVKAASQVEFVIANGAECEPLMHKDAEMMARHADHVVRGMQLLMAATGAKEGVIGLKSKHVEAMDALRPLLTGTAIRIHELGNFYPTGDEFVLVYETIGRLIPPGGYPLDVGAVVQNVETLLNIAAADSGEAVTTKFLTVTGAVRHPLSCEAPVGISFRELIEIAGGPTVDPYALFVGGVMMGRLTRDLDEPVTKTTGGLIVLPEDHQQVTRQGRPESAMHQIGKSACDQCSYCTELCHRYLLGYALEPHKVMRSLVFSMSGPDFWNQFGTLCCECGLCTLYSCPEDLYPREACQNSKRVAREQGLPLVPETTAAVTGAHAAEAHPMYESRRVPLEQLVRRLHLASYDLPAPMLDGVPTPSRIRLLLDQHVGVPAKPLVSVGQSVLAGDPVADVGEGELGARIHSSIEGTVRCIDPDVVIEA